MPAGLHVREPAHKREPERRKHWACTNNETQSGQSQCTAGDTLVQQERATMRTICRACEARVSMPVQLRHQRAAQNEKQFQLDQTTQGKAQSRKVLTEHQRAMLKAQYNDVQEAAPC